MLAKNTFSAELVRLPSFQEMFHFFVWLGVVCIKPLAHHLQKYLVNMDFDAQLIQLVPYHSQKIYLSAMV